LDAAAQKLRYQKHENTIDNPGYVDMLGRPIALMRQYARGVHRVLDYGCGPGPVLVELLKRGGYEAFGYDPLFASDTDLARVFDAVISVETFEHFADPRAELERILNLLRPNGYLVVMTQFHQGSDTIQDWWYARDPTHVAFYSHTTLDWICGEFDLELLQRDDKDLAIMQTSA
jgi:2-polyprenyl-3-methyl-5-hydroxy-6-metoxy-1,4-benzoquinol methylase